MIFRQNIDSLDAFKTFELKPRFLYLDIETNDHNIDWFKQLPERGFAIVGTRQPQRRSMDLLEKTLTDMRGSNIIIISGLARGIDSRAHELALDLGFKTIAVLGCGIDIEYRENFHLRKRIIENGGAVISQFERDYQPFKGNFLIRNRLIAGLAKAVWIVEATQISGTLNTAKHALECNRDIYATPAFPGDHFFSGNEKLLSHIHTLRHPPAYPFFGAMSLGLTWSEFNEARAHPELNLKNISELQKWVLELKSKFGECPVQTLMNHAFSQGLSFGNFYRLYEKEIDSGLIVQDLQGQVHTAQNLYVIAQKAPEIYLKNKAKEV